MKWHFWHTFQCHYSFLQTGWCLVSGRVFPVLDLLSTSVISQISFSQITFMCWVSLAQWDSDFYLCPEMILTREDLTATRTKETRQIGRKTTNENASLGQDVCVLIGSFSLCLTWLFVVREKVGLLFSGLYFSCK